MDLLRSLGEVISGRRLHKNSTNNVVISELWHRCDRLPDSQELFRDFIVATSSVSEQFFFDDDHPKAIVAKDYSVEQFRLFYDAVLAFFVHAHCTSNPQLESRMMSCIRSLVSDYAHVERLFVRLSRHNSIDSSTVGEVYEYLIGEAKIGSPLFEPFTVFTSICLVAWRELVLDYESKKWIDQRKSALEMASRMREDGAHLMLSDSTLDPDLLPEPLQSRVKKLLRQLNSHEDTNMRF